MRAHGFTLEREEYLKEAGGLVRLWKHGATGAELLSVSNRDENKSFGVSFRTPPGDSSGVAHILEHSVLCGSAGYPVKEPFVELLKSSLQTFLNALTFPDKTCYPVASANLQDFYNLVDVYLDAVFHPRIHEDVLRQEGWHVDADEAGVWQYKGVVFNEMKGVYSSPDSVLLEEAQHSVFPDTVYSLDSGGRPEEVLNLTYDAFLAFHSRFYHPSNARFFFWGDDPEDARLEKLQTVLAPYGMRAVDSAVPLQGVLPVPRKLEVAYAAGAGGEEKDESRRAHLAVSWLLCESREIEEIFVLEMLEHILTGLPGSPLRKALMDSGLGDDITGAGLETDLRQAYFSIGLRSIRPEDGDAVETLILDSLASLAENGVPGKAVEAALNSLEFDLRENNTGRFPRGLSAMFRSLAAWLYDGDPIAPLAWEKPLASIKARLANREKIFESAIRRWLLDNTHRTAVLLLPDDKLDAARQSRENARLEAARAAMTPAERDETVRVSRRLREAQEKPDPPEALASIPFLRLEDLPDRNAVLPCSEQEEADPTVILHEIDTTGIVYIRLLLPLEGVPSRLFPLLPLYARSLTEMGTARRDYVDLGMELAAKTGGLAAYPVFHTSHADASPLAFLELAGKSTADKTGNLADLMEEILNEPRFDNRERFTQMALEERARMEQGIIPAGHSLVGMRLGGRLSPAGWLAEQSGGVTYLFFIRQLIRKLEGNWPDILADLQALHRHVVRRGQALLSLTAESAGLAPAVPRLRALVRSLPSRSFPPAGRSGSDLPEAEALLVPSQVNYVGLGFNMKNLGYRFHGSAHVVLRHLRMGYLWDRVRAQGGAYGVFASYNRASGVCSFLSYRDPNVERTLDIYRAAADYLGNLRLGREELTRAVVGAIGDLDAYLLPAAKGKAALWRRLSGDDEETRQRIREEILGAKLENFHEFAHWLAKALPAANLCVMGGSDAEAAAGRHGWSTTKVL